MRCGEIAACAGVSPDTIRHYERIGLLKSPPRTAGGYRDYPPETLRRVQLIRRALAVGFSLRELTEILRVRDRGGAPCRGVLAAATAKLREVDTQIAELKAARRQITSILKDWRERLEATGKGKPAKLLENLPDELEERNHEKSARSRFDYRISRRGHTSSRPASR